MRVEMFSAELFRSWLDSTDDFLLILRAKDRRDILTSDYNTEHIAIAGLFNIPAAMVASAAHISWMAPLDQLEYHRSGKSLGKEYVINPTEEQVTTDLIIEIIKAAGFPHAKVIVV